MQAANIFFVVIGLAAIAYYLGYGRSIAVAKPVGGIRHLHSLPAYYGLQAVIWCALPAMAILSLWLMFDEPLISGIVMSGIGDESLTGTAAAYNLTLNKIYNVAEGILPREQQSPVIIAAADKLSQLQNIARWSLTVVVFALAAIGLFWGVCSIKLEFRARAFVEKVAQSFLLFCACLAIVTTLGIVLSVLFESIQFFRAIPIAEFVFGLEWSPQTAIREDQVGSSGSFGAIPLFTGTLLISAVAMLVAVPVGLMSAIYLSEYADRRVRTYAKPTLEVLAGIPTVVYGFFAALTVAPFIRELGESIGLTVSSESALAAGGVM